jgi:hypothetical protein
MEGVKGTRGVRGVRCVTGTYVGGLCYQLTYAGAPAASLPLGTFISGDDRCLVLKHHEELEMIERLHSSIRFGYFKYKQYELEKHWVIKNLNHTQVKIF